MKRKEVLEICKQCPTCVYNPQKEFNLLGINYTFPGFHSCGKFAEEIEGVQCGCVLELKSIFNSILHCPQKKW